jgi:hypothetical protein
MFLPCFLSSSGSSVNFVAMASHVFFLQSLLCLAAALLFYPVERFGDILNWGLEIIVF